MADRAAIVTGASSGIGLAIAHVLGEEGYALNVVAGGLGDEAIVQEVVRSHREKYGRLDVLVNNAGVGIGEAVADLTAKKIDMQLAVNLRSVFLFYRESVDLLRAAGAEHKNALVVNTSSISGKRGEAWLS